MIKKAVSWVTISSETVQYLLSLKILRNLEFIHFNDLESCMSIIWVLIKAVIHVRQLCIKGKSYKVAKSFFQSTVYWLFIFFQMSL